MEPSEIKFIGTTERLGKTTYREVRRQGQTRAMCSSRCAVVLEGSNSAYDLNRHALGWGYIGHSPDLLSVGLLTVTVWSNGRIIGLDDFGIIRAKFLNQCFEQDFGPWRDTVLANYKDFTQQVVSKLPDNWVMTMEEIQNWLADHSKLPRVVREQTNQNQRKHGKAKAEKEGSVV